MSRLEGFVADARARVEAGAYSIDGAAVRSNGSLVKAIADHATPVIAEVKPRSPSEGRLIQGPIEQVLGDYVTGGAAALSILTDSNHFDGDIATLRIARTTGLPVMMKDFVVDEVQVRCAAHHGCSAVLLIERLFDEAGDREELVQACHHHGLEVLLECFDEADLERASNSEADLICINARDLETLQVDAPSSLRLIKAACGIGKPVLALSGVTQRRDRRAAIKAGAQAVLVGTSLLRAADARLALRALQRPLAKVCGIKDDAALDAVIEAGADLAGFVIGAPKSPRTIIPVEARRLSDRARSAGLRTVLVTPHADSWEVREWCRLVRPDFVQLHGLRPDDDWVHSVHSIPTKVLHACAPGADVPTSGDGLLVDTPHSDQTGGTGLVHDWSVTAQMLGAIDRMNLVAGGLDASNVAEAIRQSGAWGADASSRLESSPGIKDAAKVKAFVAAAQEAQ